MSFNRLDLLPYLFALMIIYFLVEFFYRKKYFRFILDHWFYKQNLKNKISFIFSLIGLIFILLSVLDLRGPSTSIKSNIPRQKTVILIDTSSSMLVEDVRPNRFSKALLLARHFIKSAVGQQISIVLFSDYQKIYVPFTNDIDLLDARISGLSTLTITKGGSNLSQAISESVQYFEETSVEKKLLSGNILIFSDAEETVEQLEINIPQNISVAMVGVGTNKGGPIPLRDSRNIFYGNKEFEGKEVVSRLDETNLKDYAKKIKDYKYWIATSFSLPTDEINNFFKKNHTKRFSEGQITVRPTYFEYLILPGVFFISLGLLLRLGKNLSPLYFLLLFLDTTGVFASQDEGEDKKLTQEQLNQMQELAQGKSSLEDKIILAESLLKDKKTKEAKILYEESLNLNLTNEKFLESYFNYGTSLIELKERDKGLEVYQKITEHLKKVDKNRSDKILQAMKTNIIKSFKDDQKSDQNQKNEDQKNKENKGDSKENKDNKENSESQNSKSDKEQDKKNDPRNEDQLKNQKDKEKKENEKKDKKQGEEDKKNENAQPENQAEIPPELKEKLKVKIPAQLKQLMNEDRALQEKLLDTSTTEKSKRGKKDW